MQIMTAEAQKRVGESFPFSLEAEVPQQEFGARTLRFLRPLTVTGTVLFDGKAFTVEGTASTVLDSVCARCAEPFEEPFTYTFTERFMRGTERNEDDETYPFSGDRLVLDDAVMDNLYLQLPLLSVCREDCKGLCPVCGKNRNLAPCSCKTTDARNPFSVLDALRKDD